MKTTSLLFLLLLCWSIAESSAQNRQIDSLTLVDLYQSTNGAQWTHSWNLGQPINTWYGVFLDGDGRVERVDLCNNGLVGTLPLQLNLSKLRHLSLCNGAITGSIPNWMGIPALWNLSLSNNELTGAVPDFTGMPTLFTLNLSNNKLSGSIPNFRGMPELIALHLGQNRLTGTVPDFSNIRKLANLTLEYNRLGGGGPDFSNLPTLRFFRLSKNKFIGNIPNFSNLPMLQDVWLDQNQLTGSIPNFSNLSFVKILEFGDNRLTGSIPDFTNMPLLLDIKVAHNQLTGSIPAFRNCPDLEKIDVRNNQLAGRIPVFAAAANLSWLYLNENQFTFEDIVPGHNFLRNKIASNNSGTAGFGFRYIDQDSVGQTQQIALPIGVDYTMDLGVDAGVYDNVYYWYKDGVLFDSVSSSNQYTITNFQASDVGRYQVQIINTRVTDPSEPNHNLVLHSRAINLDIGTAVTSIAPIEPLLVYPNPSSDQVQIEWPASTVSMQLQLMNAQGQLVVQQELDGVRGQHLLSLENYPIGIYWLRLTSSNNRVWQTSLSKQ